MKRIMTAFILCGFSFFAIQPLFSSYNPQEKRDPFRDLLAEKVIKDRSLIRGTPQLSIDEIVLTGISKAKGNFRAIVNGPQGFPYFIKKGDKFSDGYVFSINESQVIFLKTKEKGLPLIRPKKIVKELYPEEH